MGSKAEYRAVQAAERREQREAQRRFRDLERQAKEQAKLSAAEQAKLEVETHEGRLDMLLSVHKEQGPTWDWLAVAASLPPCCPHPSAHHELRARQQMALLRADLSGNAEVLLDQARAQDAIDHRKAHDAYVSDKAEWEKLKGLSRRILDGEPQAYNEALVDLGPFKEISELGSALHFRVHSPQLLECTLKVNGVSAIPSETKSITSTGKLSVKPMPKVRFHEHYQDYICSCILRVAREVFALLPIDALLISASADTEDVTTGRAVEHFVMSAFMTRAAVAQLDFYRLDPSDAVESLIHRGDFKASRKTGAFAPITQITPADLPTAPVKKPDASELLQSVRRMREELKAEIDKLAPASAAPAE